MQVWQLMSTNVVTLDAGATLDLADDLMKLKRIRHLPVVRDGELVGLVTQRDLFRAGLSSVLQFRRGAQKEWLEKIKVREIMTRDLITGGPDMEIDAAVARMLDHKIGCLPVVSGGKLAGVLSETDCLGYLRRILEIADIRRRLAEEERPLGIS